LLLESLGCTEVACARPTPVKMGRWAVALHVPLTHERVAYDGDATVPYQFHFAIYIHLIRALI